MKHGLTQIRNMHEHPLKPLFSENWETELNPITEMIIGSAYKVSNVLNPVSGKGSTKNALAFEMRKQGFSVEQQKDIWVFYEVAEVGFYSGQLH